MESVAYKRKLIDIRPSIFEKLTIKANTMLHEENPFSKGIR